MHMPFIVCIIRAEDEKKRINFPRKGSLWKQKVKEGSDGKACRRNAHN